MARRAEDRKTYNNVPMDYFLEKCRNIDFAGLNVNLKSENPGDNGAVWFRIHHGMTMTSYGEKITVTLAPLGTGTDVHILSECAMPTQIVDYGKNKQNCAAVFRYLESGIQQFTAPRQAYRNPPAGYPYPPQPGMQAPYGQQQDLYARPPQSTPNAPKPFVFCTECGTKNGRGCNFCMNCGTKLIKA